MNMRFTFIEIWGVNVWKAKISSLNLTPIDIRAKQR